MRVWVESVDGGEVEHEVGDDRTRRSRRRPGRPRRRTASRCVMPPSSRSASVTTGLKCAPDTGPKARISATRPAPVAIEFSSSCRPTSSGREPLGGDARADDDATRNAVPTASAVGRRTSARSIDRSRSAAARGRLGRRPRSTVASAPGSTRAQLPGGHLDVGEHGVDLPRLAVGAVDPDLVLHRVAARHLVLGRAGQARRPASRSVAAPTSSVDSTSTPRWLSEPRLAVALDEHQLERRLGDGEVGVAGPDLGRLGREQLRVEGDRRRRGRTRSGRAGLGTWSLP